MPSSLALSLPFIAAAALLLFSGGERWVTADQPSSQQKLWATYWTVQPGFTSTLEMKNNLTQEPLSARVSLYFASGEEYPLDAVTLGPRQTVVLDLNRVIDSLPAPVRWRGGTEGTVEAEFNAPTASSLMGSVSVTNPERGIAWNFSLYAQRPDATPLPLRGLFWFASRKTDGFVALQNVSADPVSLAPRFEIASHSYRVAPVSLAPSQSLKFELRKELLKLGLSDVTAGGIEFVYQGIPDALKAHGVLFDNQGFSAEIDFVRFDSSAEQGTFFLRTPRFAIGEADPVLGLPLRTKFEPVVALHNFEATPLSVMLRVGYAQGDAQQVVKIPLSIAAGDTSVVSLHPYLQGAVSGSVPWASLEVTHTGQQGNLAASMVSVSQDGEHSIRSVLNWVEGSNREGWYWRADAEHNTLVSILNTDTADARLAVSLDYYLGGVSHSYTLPERTLPPGATSLVNIGQLIAAGQPDANGNILPAGVTAGGYHVRKLGLYLDKTITTEALVFDRRTKSFTTFYNTCCGMAGGPTFSPDQFSGPPGPLGSFLVQGTDYCSGQTFDLTLSSTFSSDNTTIATVSTAGAATGVAVGSTNSNSSITFSQQKTVDTCITKTAYAKKPTTVSTVEITGGLNFAFVGGDPSIPEVLQQAVGKPSGGTYSWTASPANRITFDNPSADIVHLAGSNPSTSVRDTTLTVNYTYNSVPAKPPANLAVTSRIFKYLVLRSSVAVPPPSGQYGYDYRLNYDTYTNPGGQLVQPGFSGISVPENLSVTSTNIPGATTHTSTGATDANTEFTDRLPLISNAPIPSGVDEIDSQDIFVGGIFVRNNTIHYTATTVTVTNNGPTS